MKFYTPFNRPPDEYEHGGGRILTEQAHVSTKNQVEAFMLAGQRLAQTRLEQFQLSSLDQSDDFDPLREPNFDLVDAARLREAAASRIKDQISKSSKPVEPEEKVSEKPAEEPKE